MFEFPDEFEEDDNENDGTDLGHVDCPCGCGASSAAMCWNTSDWESRNHNDTPPGFLPTSKDEVDALYVDHETVGG